jgi:hypothetical protein
VLVDRQAVIGGDRVVGLGLLIVGLALRHGRVLLKASSACFLGGGWPVVVADNVDLQNTAAFM